MGDERPAWLNAAVAGVGAVAGLAIWGFVEHGGYSDRTELTVVVWLVVATVGVAYTLTAVRPLWSVAFALGSATVAALVVRWNGVPGAGYGAGDSVWRALSLCLALAVAVPLFQTLRDEGRRALPYPALHRNAWTNVVVAIGSGLFNAVVFLLFALWGGLFDLIGVGFFEDLFGEPWFVATALGGAAAGGTALLFDWSRIVGTLQRVVMAVLGILAPLLGFALLLFLGFLPFTGLDALWGATKATTPILLATVLLALVLCNAVLGDGEGEPKSRVLDLAARALAFAILPLAAIAAVSTGLRVAQYGLTPDRCWALIFVTFAVAYGLAYALPLLRPAGWALAVRRANVWLALGIGGAALVLATPLLDFAKLSAADQTARLLDGRVAVGDFDFAALKYDFGPPGKAALAKLRVLKDHPQAAAIRAEVARVDASDNRYDRTSGREREARLAKANAAFAEVVQVGGEDAPPELRQLIVESGSLSDCANTGINCAMLLVDLSGDGEQEAVAFVRRCGTTPCRVDTRGWSVENGKWQEGLPVAGLPRITAAEFDAVLEVDIRVSRSLHKDLVIGGRRIPTGTFSREPAE
jgi:hypothetical protein